MIVVVLTLATLVGVVSATIMGADPTVVVQAELTMAVVGGPVVVVGALWLERSSTEEDQLVPPPNGAFLLGILLVGMVSAVVLTLLWGPIASVLIGLVAGLTVVLSMGIPVMQAEQHTRRARRRQEDSELRAASAQAPQEHALHLP